MSARHPPKRQPSQARPATVRVHLPLLEAVRARFPVARDWTDAQVTAACLGWVIKAQPPRVGHVHGE